MGQSRQNIVLPQNIVDALLANPSSPSAANAFVTFADLAGIGNDSIYTADGTTFLDVDVTVDGQMNWIVTAGNEMAFGPTAFAPSGSYHFKSSVSSGAFFDAVGNTAADFALRARQLDGTSMLQVAGTVVDIVPTSGQFRVGGTLGSPALFTVTGDGTTSATYNTILQSSAGNDRFMVRDNGQIFTGTGQNAAAIASIGQYNLATGFTYGFAFYGTNMSTASMIVQGLGTTKIGILGQLAGSPTGVAAGLQGRSWQTTSSTNYGVYGSGRNGTSISAGVFGEIPGGGTQASATYVAALRGWAHSNQNQDMYGTHSLAGQDSSGIVYTNIDFIGVFGWSTASTNVGSSGIKSIGGKFTAINGDSNIAILVPTTANDGIVVINADDVSGNGNAQVEVTGNIETIGAGNGYIAEADDGERVLMQLVNVSAGVYAWDTGTVL